MNLKIFVRVLIITCLVFIVGSQITAMTIEYTSGLNGFLNAIYYWGVLFKLFLVCYIVWAAIKLKNSINDVSKRMGYIYSLIFLLIVLVVISLR